MYINDFIVFRFSCSVAVSNERDEQELPIKKTNKGHRLLFLGFRFYPSRMDRERQGMKNSDVISNLPDNITERILARLPIRDAVRTSVLSRNWRYKWTTLPDLVFDALGTDDSTFYSYSALQVVDEDKLVKVIYRILSQHKGPIHKFSLSVRSLIKSYPDVDQWIKCFLSVNGIREFLLIFKDGNWYKIHSSIFSCANLRQLNLHCCVIPSPPPTFSGFNDLTCLHLERVSVSNEGFQNLIAKCPKLNTLFLKYVDGLDRLDIDYAPNLANLTFSGSPKYICLKNTPHLTIASISFTQLPNMINENIGNGRSISLINNLKFLSALRMFIGGSYFLKFLGQGSVRKLLPSRFKNLYLVYFRALMFEDIDSLSSVLGLIASSPNLIKIIVTASSTGNSAADQELKTVAEYLVGESRSIGCLMQLKYVEMKNIVGVGPEMELIKLILAKSPSLKHMKIAPNKTVDGFKERELKIFKDLIRFPRASTIAEIIYQD
ncbi:hypothetical protein PTKIN_Ptkin02bG0033200 [Pterospermum kingtungense]